MRRLTTALTALFFLTSAGCAFYSAPVVPAIAGVFTNISAPLDIDYEETKLGSKVGKASAISILGLFAFGDASAASAARDGGITTIRHADYEYLNVLGVYTSFTTIVRGD